MKRVLFVGQSPKTYLNKKEPFVGTTSYRRLMTWLNCLGPDVQVLFTNATQEVAGKSITENDLMELNKVIQDFDPDYIIALGKLASNALTHIDVAHLAGPHPSGLNRKLNDKQFVDKWLKLMIEYVNG